MVYYGQQQLFMVMCSKFHAFTSSLLVNIKFGLLLVEASAQMNSLHWSEARTLRIIKIALAHSKIGIIQNLKLCIGPDS